MYKVNLCWIGRFKRIVIFIIFSGLLWSGTSTATIDTKNIKNCKNVEQAILNPNDSLDADKYWLLENVYKPNYIFANSPNGMNCQKWLIERIYFDYGQALLEFAKSLQNKALVNYSTQASEVFTKYLEWWTGGLDEADKDNIFKSNNDGIDLQSSKGKQIKSDWLRQRPGGVVRYLIEAELLSNNHNELLTKLETYGQGNNIYIFNQESVQEWNKWLSSQNDFQRQKESNVEIKKVNETCDLCNERWKAFGKFLDKWLAWNVSATSDIKVIKASLSRRIS